MKTMHVITLYIIIITARSEVKMPSKYSITKTLISYSVL